LIEPSEIVDTITKSTPKLFGRLAPELRNAMYEYAFVEDEILDIKHLQQPLTRVSRAYRDEALGIFYRKNKWECKVSNFDHKTLLRHQELDKQYGPLTVDICHNLTADTPTLKENMMIRLETAFEKPFPSLGNYNGRDDYFECSVHSDRIAKLFTLSWLLKDNLEIEWPRARWILSKTLNLAGVCCEAGVDW
jgi:hypothetical protein